jgi:UDP-sulfoquinovose synthase
LQCVFISALNPPKKGELRIFNQIVETLSVKDIAEKISFAGKEIGLNVKLENIKNPRIEKESHYYNPVHQGLIDLGVKPNYLTNKVIIKMLELVSEYKKNINKDLFFKGIKW